MGDFRSRHHRGAQDSGHHRVALPALQLSLGGFRSADRAHGLDLPPGRHRGRTTRRCRCWRRPEREACAIRSRRSTRPSPAAAPKLDAALVRTLLGGFSLESLYRVTEALTESSPGRMLAIVEDLERNGSNLQHFSREVARFFRNLLVAKVGDVKLIAGVVAGARAAGRDRAPVFRRGSDAVSAALARSVQRFAGFASAAVSSRIGADPDGVRREANTNRGGAGQPGARPSPKPAPPPAAKAPFRSLRLRPKGPSPFELDRAKKAGPPASDDEWKERLHAALMEIGMPFTADGVEHSTIAASAANCTSPFPNSSCWA